MTPHSIFVCVSCDDADLPAVAKAVFDQKPCGTAYHTISGGNSHLENVTDAYGNAYPVYIHTPDSVNVNIRLVVRNRSFSGADITASVKEAAKSWFDDHNFSIGETVYASDITKAVETALPGVIVLACAVSDGGSHAADSYNSADEKYGQGAVPLSYLDIAASRVATTDLANIEVDVK